MTKENKRIFNYVKYQMVHGVDFEAVCNNLGYYSNSLIEGLIEDNKALRLQLQAAKDNVNET